MPGWEEELKQIDLAERVTRLEKEIAALKGQFSERPKNSVPTMMPDRNDKNYYMVREIVEIFRGKKLLIHEAYTILEQVKAVIGYTRI